MHDAESLQYKNKNRQVLLWVLSGNQGRIISARLNDISACFQLAFLLGSFRKVCGNRVVIINTYYTILFSSQTAFLKKSLGIVMGIVREKSADTEPL
jgi:hypothetical protein